jgi:hypothetical protein
MDALLSEIELTMEELRQLGVLVTTFSPDKQENVFARMYDLNICVFFNYLVENRWYRTMLPSVL